MMRHSRWSYARCRQTPMTHSRPTHRRLHRRLLCMPMSPRARCHCQCCHQHPHPHLHPIRIPQSRPRLSSRPRRSHTHRRPMHHHSVTHRHQPMMHQMPWCCQRSSMHCHRHYCRRRCCYRPTSRSTRLHQRRSCQSRRTQRLWRLRWHCRMRSARLHCLGHWSPYQRIESRICFHADSSLRWHQ